MSDNAVNNFRLIGSNYTKDFVLEWRQSPFDNNYYMYNVVMGDDEPNTLFGAMFIRN